MVRGCPIMTIDEVRLLFKQVSDYIRIISTEKEIEFNETNLANQDLYDTLKTLVDQLGREYPLQAKIIRLRYFELKPLFKISQVINYSDRLIRYKENDGLRMIAERLSKSNYSSSFNQGGIGL